MKGLVTESELMRLASVLNRSESKLTQEQTEITAQAIENFKRKGVDAAKATEAVTKAVTSLSFDGMKELGVWVDSTGLAMDTQSGRGDALKRVLASLTIESKQFAAAQLTAGEQALKTAVKMEDAIDKLERHARKGASKAAELVESAATEYIRQAMGGMGDWADKYDPRTTLSAIQTDWRLQAKALKYQSNLNVDVGPVTATPVVANANKPTAGYARSAQATRTVQQALAALSASLGTDVANL